MRLAGSCQHQPGDELRRDFLAWLDDRLDQSPLVERPGSGGQLGADLRTAAADLMAAGTGGCLTMKKDSLPRFGVAGDLVIRRLCAVEQR